MAGSRQVGPGMERTGEESSRKGRLGVTWQGAVWSVWDATGLGRQDRRGLDGAMRR